PASGVSGSARDRPRPPASRPRPPPRIRSWILPPRPRHLGPDVMADPNDEPTTIHAPLAPPAAPSRRLRTHEPQDVVPTRAGPRPRGSQSRRRGIGVARWRRSMRRPVRPEPSPILAPPSPMGILISMEDRDARGWGMGLPSEI